ncbi:MAG: hypothetical protein FWG24_06985 [Eggerthellaceae bacterium]|nr:hypothetical protein [Eggerthellaceae bacterium]
MRNTWEIAFVFAVAVLVGGLVVALYRSPRLRRVKSHDAIARLRRAPLKPLFIVLISVFLSLVILSFPTSLMHFGSSAVGVLESILLSIQSVLQIFMINARFDSVLGGIDGLNSWVHPWYILLTSTLCVVAPILVFGVALSFVRVLSAWLNYRLFSFRCDAFIFSALNSRSLALAESVSEHYSQTKKRRPIIFFTNVHAGSSFAFLGNDHHESDKSNYELIEKSRLMGAICIKQDILSFRFDVHSKQSQLNYIIIGDNKTQNNAEALEIINRYSGTEAIESVGYRVWQRTEENTSLFVFESSKGSELLLDGKGSTIKVRRINRIRSFVYDFLWKNGHELFAASKDVANEKHIGAVIVGLGKSGTEMLKALSWYCQMDGYSLKIDAFDSREDAQQKLELQAPELVGSKFQNSTNTGEAQYSIKVHAGVDVECQALVNEINNLADSTTFVFVSLGDDDKSLEVAVALRVLFERAGRTDSQPHIYSVIHDSLRQEHLIKTYTQPDTSYGIRFIGAYEEMFSYDTVFNSALEKQAKELHMSWADKDCKESTAYYEEKWKHEYYRNSSMAQLLHKDARNKLSQAFGEGNTPQQPTIQPDNALSNALSNNESLNKARLEHRRWNAYMRSEGWVYASTRNDLAKTHCDLVSFDELPYAEQQKDYTDKD